MHETEQGVIWTLVKVPEQICINMKRISAIAFDTTKNSLLLIREKRVEAEETFEVYSVNLKKNLEPNCEDTNLADVALTDVAKVLCTLNVFTTRISVFSEEEALTVAAYYN